MSAAYRPGREKLGQHLGDCRTCQDALIQHDTAYPKCMDVTCPRIAYCPAGTQLAEDVWGDE